jgi:hypothetical protein
MVVVVVVASVEEEVVVASVVEEVVVASVQEEVVTAWIEEEVAAWAEAGVGAVREEEDVEEVEAEVDSLHHGQ